MSTISDALKKVQTNRPDDTRRIVPPSSVTSHPAAASSGSRLTAVVVAVLVLCLVLFLFITRSKNPSPQPSPAAPKFSPSPLEEEGGGEGRVTVEPVAVKAPPLPLPLPLPSPPPPAPLPILSGTFYSTQNPVAIINGSSLKEGETVGAYQVIKILPRSVILKSSAGDIELRLQ
ncbi:MAG: hypothetical protein WCL49_10955 [bacterium]